VHNYEDKFALFQHEKQLFWQVKLGLPKAQAQTG
jgi:hypothetical protein